MARGQETIIRRMWIWTTGLLIFTVILWTQRVDGQGQGRCKQVLVFSELDVGPFTMIL